MQFSVHAQRLCLCVHRETTGVLKEWLSVNAGPQTPLEAHSEDWIVLHLGVGYFKGSGFV